MYATNSGNSNVLPQGLSRKERFGKMGLRSYVPITIGISNHLGNVLSVISDKVIPHASGGSVAYYKADILQSQDYSPFGVTLKGRNLKKTGLADEFRFGFNGMEADDEMKGDGNSYDFGARMFDPRLGRFLSLDHYLTLSSYNSPYLFASNTPIIAIDLNGDSTYLVLYGKGYLSTYSTDHDQKDAFKKQAEARKTEIENRKGFDPTRDKVVLMEIPNTDRAIAVINENYPSGKIAELHIYSHGSQNSVSLGGRKVGDTNTDGSIVTQQEQNSDWGDTDGDGLKDTYDNRELNKNTIVKIDKTKFETTAKVFLWGCNMGGVDVNDYTVKKQNPWITSYTQTQISESSIGNDIAKSLNVSVSAFTGFSEAKSVNKNAKAPLTYDGIMIRTKDRSSQKANFTEFKAGGGVSKLPK